MIEERKAKIYSITVATITHQERIGKLQNLVSKLEKTIESQRLSIEGKQNRLQDRLEKLKRRRIACVKSLPIVFPLQEVAISSQNSVGEITDAISEAAAMNYCRFEKIWRILILKFQIIQILI